MTLLKKLDVEKLQSIALMYMEGIGFGDQPYLVYQHFDAAHPHLHIVTSLVQKDGKRINTHNIGKNKSEPCRKEIEQAFNLVRAEDHPRNTRQQYHPVEIGRATYGKDEIRKTLGRVVSQVVKDYKFTSLAELNAALRRYNVAVDNGAEGSYLRARRGLQYRLLDQYGNKVGVPIKASLIYSKPTLVKLEQCFTINKDLRKNEAHTLKNAIETALNSADRKSVTTFAKLLAKQNIDVILRTNDTGRIYGITFVDHRSRSVFNGSDIGKAYSANALTTLLSDSSVKSITGSRNTPLDNHLGARDAKTDAPGLLDTLLEQEQQADTIPYDLGIKKKRKKNKRSPNK